MPDFIKKNSVIFKPCDQIFSYFENMNNWNLDNINSASSIYFTSTLRAGGTGLFISKNGRQFKFKIIDVHEREGLTIQASTPFGRVFLQHTLRRQKCYSILESTIWISGIFSNVLMILLSRNLRQHLLDFHYDLEFNLTKKSTLSLPIFDLRALADNLYDPSNDHNWLNG